MVLEVWHYYELWFFNAGIFIIIIIIVVVIIIVPVIVVGTW